MPPVTPSPFRFITKPTKNISKDSTGSSSPPAQFAPTPRFQIPQPTQREAGRRTPFSAPPRLRYNVTETLPNTPTTTTTTTRPSFRTPTTHVHEAIEEADGSAFPTSPLHKRRRVGGSSSRREGEDIDPTSSPPPTSSKPKPRTRVYDSGSDSEPDDHAAQTRSGGGHGKRFLFTPAPHSVPSTPTVSHHLRTIRAPQERVGVPVDWSPRKSRAVGKWAVGGLAAEAAGWIVEAQTACVTGGGVVTASEVRRGDGMFIVRGVDERGGSVRVLLPAPPNRGNGLVKEVPVGARIACRLPSWEVTLQGEKYKFLAAWRVDE